MLKEKDAQSQFLKEESDSNWLQEKAKIPKILQNSFVKMQISGLLKTIQ